jgi:ABC-type amino acid transport substrate-binding protein
LKYLFKKLCFTVLSGLLTTHVLFPQSYPPEIKAIKDRGKLIVAMYYKDVKPFIMTAPDNSLVGHEVDLAKDIAVTLGVELSIDRKSKTFNEITELVSLGKADLGISLISRTLARAEKVIFSNPYIILHPTLLLNRLSISKLKLDDKDPVGSLTDIPLKIGEKKGTSYVDFAKTVFPKATIVEYPEWEDAIDAVFKGEVFAVLRDEIGVKNYIYQFPEQSINLKMIVLTDPQYDDPLAIALPPQSLHLRDWVNLYLERKMRVKSADDLFSEYKAYYENK